MFLSGSDEQSVSSSSASGGGGSRGTSRTPSPFSISSASSASTAPSHALPASHVQKGFGNCPLPCAADGFNGGAEVSMRQGAQGETYSRKVFVGGLPPDIDQGENGHTPHFNYITHSCLLCTV